MKRAAVFVCAAVALLAGAGGCGSNRRAESSAAESTHMRVVRAVVKDSLRLTAVVELDGPRLTLRPDSGLHLEASSGRAAVVAEAARTSAQAVADSAAEARNEARSEAQTGPGGGGAGVWPVVMWLLLIALSLTGIRSRR